MQDHFELVYWEIEHGFRVPSEALTEILWHEIVESRRDLRPEKEKLFSTWFSRLKKQADIDVETAHILHDRYVTNYRFDNALGTLDPNYRMPFGYEEEQVLSFAIAIRLNCLLTPA